MRNTLYSKHILHNFLSLWLGLVKVGGKRCYGSGMGTGEGPEGVFILKQLEQKENQDVNRPFQVHVCKIKHTYREPEWWNSLCLSTR